MTLQLPFPFVDNPEQQANNEAIRLAMPDTALDVMHIVGDATTGLGTAFAGTWVNFGASYIPAGFYRSGGRVYLSGLVKSGVVGTALFTLPVGYRPAPYGVVSGVDLILPIVSAGVLGVVTVSVGGLVTLASGSNVYVDLSSISFRHV